MEKSKIITGFIILSIIVVTAVVAVRYFFIVDEEQNYINQLEFEEKLKSTAKILLVDDVSASIDFYAKHIGFSLYKVFPLEGKPTLAVLSLRKHYIMLQDKRIFYEEKPKYIGGEIEPSFSLYIDAENVDSLYNSMKDELEIVQDYQLMFYERYEFSVKDLDGHIITFSETVEQDEQIEGDLNDRLLNTLY